MVRLTKLESESLKGHEISPAMRAVLGHVFVSMPWNYLDRYIDLVLENKINVEIGFGTDVLQMDQTGIVCATVGRMRDEQCRFTVHGPFWDLCSGSIDPGIREVTRSRLGSLFDLAELIHAGADRLPYRFRSKASSWASPVVDREQPFHTGAFCAAGGNP